MHEVWLACWSHGPNPPPVAVGIRIAYTLPIAALSSFGHDRLALSHTSRPKETVIAMV